MPFGKRWMAVPGSAAVERVREASSLAVEPIGLVLRLEHALAYVWDRGSLLSFQPSAMGLQNPQGDFESGRDVLLVHQVPTAQVLVGDTRESSAGSDVLP